MFEEIMRDVEGLSAEELEEVIARLQGLVLEALEGPDCEPDTCPWCGSAHFVRKGFDKVFEGGVVVEKTQRYLCCECRKTFTRRTLGLLAWSKLDARTWSEYVGLEVERNSIEDMAEQLGVNASTVHFMRYQYRSVIGTPSSSGRPTSGRTCGEFRLFTGVAAGADVSHRVHRRP